MVRPRTLRWGKDGLDTRFEPCPFCGKGNLLVSGADRAILHVLPTCPTYDKIKSLGDLTDELTSVRRRGFPHGKPKLSGPLPDGFNRKDWS